MVMKMNLTKHNEEENNKSVEEVSRPPSPSAVHRRTEGRKGRGGRDHSGKVIEDSDTSDQTRLMDKKKSDHCDGWMKKVDDDGEGRDG